MGLRSAMQSMVRTEMPRVIALCRWRASACEKASNRVKIYAAVASCGSVSNSRQHRVEGLLRSSNPSGAILIPALDLDSATNRIHDARKLRQHAIAGGVENAPAMLLDFRADEFAVMRFETIERGLFVGANQARVPATWAAKIAQDARLEATAWEPTCARSA